MSNLSHEELELLRDTAARYFEEQMPIDALRKLRDSDEPSAFDAERWQEMADMGWLGILTPEAQGGIELGYRALGTVIEQSGRTLAATPLLSTVGIASACIVRLSSNSFMTDVLTALLAGQRLVSLALEETRRHAPAAISTRVEDRDGGYEITGEKRLVIDGQMADHFIVVAKTAGADRSADRLTLLLVDAGADGLECVATRLVDGRHAANLKFDKVQVAADRLLGTAGEGAETLAAVLDGARALIAAEMLGSGQEAFDRTIEYLKIREQFGRPIGSFQALKHRAAVMYCEIELTRSAVYAALDALDRRADDSASVVSLAKAKACDTLELVTNEAIQMHGGIGMTDEADIGLFLKRAAVTKQLFGDAMFHRRRYAEQLNI